jgi:DNA-binding CsgD family transcriptional regulator
LIGHALAFAPRPATTAAWQRAIAVGFAAGSTCFLIGPFPGFVQLVGAGADGVVFFAGSVLFTLAAALELREGTVRRGRRWGADPSWWSAATQFVGTLLFNVSLTDREREVLAEIAQGKSNLAIAESLGLSPRAVEKHTHSIFSKLELASSADVSKRVKAALLYLADGEGPPG